ncbi:hypothetical protein U1Q18_001930 [Sarracenia purpurea var. burkii]
MIPGYDPPSCVEISQPPPALFSRSLKPQKPSTSSLRLHASGSGTCSEKGSAGLGSRFERGRQAACAGDAGMTRVDNDRRVEGQQVEPLRRLPTSERDVVKKETDDERGCAAAKAC